jgi:hypothetical protein
MINNEKTKTDYGYLPSELSNGSHKKVAVTCDYCNTDYTMSYYKYNTSNKQVVNKDACKNCKVKKSVESNKITGNYEKMTTKRTQTNIEKYGCSVAANSVEGQAKTKETNLAKYGNEYHIASEDIKNKILNSNIEKYGVSCVFKTQEFKDKIRQQNIDKYGVPCNSQLQMPPGSVEKLSNKEWLIDQHHTHQKSLTQISKELGLSGSTKTISDAMHRHNIEIIKTQISSLENEILKYIQSVYQGQIEQSNRNIIAPKELDIYIPEHNLAIEFCGLYWHSDEFIKDTKYHQNKYLECEKKDITLITVFEDEWNNNPEIIKGKIQHHLLQSFPVYARKCEIVTVSVEAEREFLNKHHIQGYVASKVCIGLEFKGTLIAIMSFGTPRYNKKYEYELLRYATDGSVVGGGSKLLTHFEKTHNPTNLISYCNLRYGSGKMYESLGFEYSHTSNPSYYYVKNGKRFNRQSLTKKKMIETYGFLDTQTEFQMAESLGYSKIYDCGNKVFVKSYTT